jgi:hypothetical protein
MHESYHCWQPSPRPGRDLFFHLHGFCPFILDFGADVYAESMRTAGLPHLSRLLANINSLCFAHSCFASAGSVDLNLLSLPHKCLYFICITCHISVDIPDGAADKWTIMTGCRGNITSSESGRDVSNGTW